MASGESHIPKNARKMREEWILCGIIPNKQMFVNIQNKINARNMQGK
jgi:hypothetical protein